MNRITEYAKTLVAAVGAAASVLTALNVHAPWVSAVVALATALGVYAVPNKRPGTATSVTVAVPPYHDLRAQIVKVLREEAAAAGWYGKGGSLPRERGGYAAGGKAVTDLPPPPPSVSAPPKVTP